MRRAVLLGCLVACGSSSGGEPADSSCKRGLAYGYNSSADLAALSPGISWWYNWALAPDAEAKETHGVSYVPMIWGQSALANATLGDSTAAVLAFNEPDFTSQSNLTPDQAAALWPMVEAAAGSRTIVSPALNYCGGGCNETDPFVWFDKFFAACTDCRVDAIAVHWYACTKDALASYLTKMQKYGKPIWLTEFACLDDADISVAKQQAYMTDALAYLEAEPTVARYAWFTGRSESSPTIALLGGDGELTDLGHQYVEASATCGN